MTKERRERGEELAARCLSETIYSQNLSNFFRQTFRVASNPRRWRRHRKQDLPPRRHGARPAHWERAFAMALAGCPSGLVGGASSMSHTEHFSGKVLCKFCDVESPLRQVSAPANIRQSGGRQGRGGLRGRKLRRGLRSWFLPRIEHHRARRASSLLSPCSNTKRTPLALTKIELGAEPALRPSRALREAFPPMESPANARATDTLASDAPSAAPCAFPSRHQRHGQCSCCGRSEESSTKKFPSGCGALCETRWR